MNKPYLLITFGVLAVVLAGCGSKDQTSPPDKITLVIWETYKGKERTLFLELVKRFQAEYQQKTGQAVEIVSQRVPFDDLVTSIKTACLTRKTPDLARIDALKVLELAYHQVLIPLDSLANFGSPSIEAKGHEFAPGAFATNVVEIKGVQHLYGLPEQTTCLALFWNRKLFAQDSEALHQAGLDPLRPPATWDELIAYGQILTHPEKGQYGFAMNNSLWFTLPFLGCYQAQFLSKDKDGKWFCNLGDARSCAALQLKADLYSKYKIEAGAWKSGALGPDVGFLQQKYAMILMGPWCIEDFRGAGLDLGIGLIPRVSRAQAERLGFLPKDASPEEYLAQFVPATNVGGNNWVIFKTCLHPQLVYRFIEFMVSVETQLQWCRTLKQIPVNRKAAECLRQDPTIDHDLQIFMQQALYAQAPPRLPRYGYVESDLVNPEMELALRGLPKGKTVEQSLRDAAGKIDERVLSLVNE